MLYYIVLCYVMFCCVMSHVYKECCVYRYDECYVTCTYYTMSVMLHGRNDRYVACIHVYMYTKNVMLHVYGKQRMLCYMHTMHTMHVMLHVYSTQRM